MRSSARALFVLGALVLLASVRPAAADESVDLFLQGAHELQAGRWEDAERTLERAQTLRPGDGDVQALLGIARYALGRLEESVESCRAALREGTRYEARALYTLGIALGRLGEDDDAQEAFARLLREHPDSEEAKRLREKVSGPRFRPWSLQALGSLQLDDNPIRGTRVEDLGFEIPGPDWLWQVWLSGSRRFAGSPPVLRATVFRMDYFDTDFLDFTFVETGVEAALVDTRRTRIVPGYDFRSSWLGSDRFETRHALEVEATRALGVAWSSVLDLSAATRNHPEPAYEELDGGELTGALSLERRGAARSLVRSSRLGVEASHSGARVDYLASTNLGASLGATLRLPDRAGLGLSVDVRRRRFGETDPRYLVRRKDMRVRGTVSVSLPIARAAQVSLRAALSNNDSEIRRYDYRQLVVGATVAASF